MTDQNWEKIQKTNSDRLALFQQLHIYGDIIPLRMVLDLEQLNSELESFAQNWIPYNPEKTGNPREGLSVTSLDGGMTGVPDLFSIYEWSKQTGRKVSESDFNQVTPAYTTCRSIHRLFEPFLPNVGRCRFVRFQPGGHFPPHRDGSVSYQIPDYFRILVPLKNTGVDQFHFIHDGRLVDYEPGRPYLFNALKTHSVMSFVPDAVTLALSVPLTQKSVAAAIELFKIY